jgi:hypothetical protein
MGLNTNRPALSFSVLVSWGGLEIRECGLGIYGADHATPLYPQKLALTSPTSGGRSEGIIRSRTKVTEFSFFLGWGETESTWYVTHY